MSRGDEQKERGCVPSDWVSVNFIMDLTEDLCVHHMISFLYQWFPLRKSKHVLLLTVFCFDLILRLKRCLTVVRSMRDLPSTVLPSTSLPPTFFPLNILCPFIVSHGSVYRFSLIHLLRLTASPSVLVCKTRIPESEHPSQKQHLLFH